MNAQTQIVRCTCPTCGGYIGEVPIPDKVREVLPSLDRMAFDVLAGSMPLGVDKVTLSTHLFGEKHGITEAKIHHTAVVVSRLRKALERFGYHIPRNTATERAVYKLVPMEAGA